MKRIFIVLAILMSFKASSASATCYQASKCVVPFIPALNHFLGGDMSCFYRINTQARAAGREVRAAIIEQELSLEAAFEGLDIQMVGVAPIENMSITILPNVPDAQCD